MSVCEESGVEETGDVTTDSTSNISTLSKVSSNYSKVSEPGMYSNVCVCVHMKLCVRHDSLLSVLTHILIQEPACVKSRCRMAPPLTWKTTEMSATLSGSPLLRYTMS